MILHATPKQVVLLILIVIVGLLAIFESRQFLIVAPLPFRRPTIFHSLIAVQQESGPTQPWRCDDVLTKMLSGRWKPSPMTMEQVETMRRFHNRVYEEHNIPKGVQRQDMKCGNRSVGKGGLMWFRALCDPEGQTPCCYENRCVNKSVEQCACPQCWDMRTPIHAEYATWQPVDRSCEPRSQPTKKICRLLRNWTLLFIGDSFVRHVFTAFLLAVTGNDFTGAFKANIPKNLRSQCSGIYMFTEKECRLWLDTNPTICNGSATLRHEGHFTATNHHQHIHDAILNQANRSRSFVFFGVGQHDHLNASVVIHRVLKPLLEDMSSRRLVWPKLLWAGVHRYGLMKAPADNQVVAVAENFNGQIKAFLAQYGVPVFDTFNLTAGVRSFDGAHYGFGVNRLKARILLYYLKQLHSQ